MTWAARFRSELGVAMITVMFIGAGLTAVSATATFVAIKELRAGTDDRKGAEALAYAEAGVDRVINYLRSGRVTWGEFRFAGCTVSGTYYPPFAPPGGPAPAPGAGGGQGQFGTGNFTASMTVYDPSASGDSRRPPAACPSSDPGPLKGNATFYYVITSEGRAPAARRVVRQVMRVKALGLPVGLYSESTDANGTPNLGNCLASAPEGEGISMVTTNDVTGRVQMGFCGIDPYYTLSDFWPALSSTTKIRSAVHSTGTIYTKQNLINGQEHPAPNGVNCTANPKGTAGQSQWDQSSKGGDITQLVACAGQTALPPPTSDFEDVDRLRVAPRPQLAEQDYQVLKASAKQGGIYCYIPDLGVPVCTEHGAPSTLNPMAGVAAIPAGLDNNFVAYFEFQTDRDLDIGPWTANYGRCNDPPNSSSPNQSMVVVVRRGGLSMTAGGTNRGAFLVPEGTFKDRGGGTIVGTVIAEKIDLGGGSTIRLDNCWVKNMPGPFMEFSPFHFSEVDR